MIPGDFEIMRLDDIPAIEIGDETVSLFDLLRQAKFNDALHIFESAIDAELIRQAAEERGIEVTDEELQEAADQFRLSRELHEVEALEAWLDSHHLTLTDWETELERTILTSKVAEAIADGQIERYFAENKLRFDAAAISRIVLESEDVAKELRAQLIEEEADFHKLAREHSVDNETRKLGGHVGVIARTDLDPVVESAVFGSKPDQIIGPFKLDSEWHLIKIEAIKPAKLDEEIRQTIKSTLFSEWLAEKRRKVKISIPLLASMDENDEEVEEAAIGEGA